MYNNLVIDYKEALKAMKDGRKISFVEDALNDKDIYMILNNGHIGIYKDDKLDGIMEVDEFSLKFKQYVIVE